MWGLAASAAANVIDGADDRESLIAAAGRLGLDAAEVARIRKATGFVGCLSPSPSMGTGVLFLDGAQVLTAAHILFEPSGRPRSKCFFKNQDADPVVVDLVTVDGYARFGAARPKPGSAEDYAVVRLAAPVAGAVPFGAAEAPPAVGERLVVITAHPAGMAKEVDKGVPVAQGCVIRKVPALKPTTPKPTPTPKSTTTPNPAATPGSAGAAGASGPAQPFRTDCDATGSSSGGANLMRLDGGQGGGPLVLRGITISTGPWRNPKLAGAPYDERKGSFTTALDVSGAIAAAGRDLARTAPPPPAGAGGVASAAVQVRAVPVGSVDLSGVDLSGVDLSGAAAPPEAGVAVPTGPGLPGVDVGRATRRAVPGITGKSTAVQP
ncbi:hypothetical protein SAMN02745172_02041 [Pseudoxanthobacter soli DSM 19599]|uniref:Trypsin-like peptidase domain-containing protein n=1 Tax=Pseudoxanthobacter soli DSM 19599 TaxID=1123029 RepID=A0A1M7ZK05_9HYPH|nr:trypsin-like peptidase domain-containing protein [Pseudoxanthobacter soli]SHO65234.1 hypothetical protein SAMN02745172_02041 [Pseudoxanthobacter soli DSM 19599]